MKKQLEHCPGNGCPLKVYCRRFKSSIDRLAEDHFAFTPYNHAKKDCEFKELISAEENIIELKKEISDGRRNN